MAAANKRKIIIAGIAGAAFAVAGIAMVASATSQETNQWDHFWTCFGDMIVAPDVHAAQCLPNRNPPDNVSLSEPVSDGPDAESVPDGDLPYSS